ncbi:hypothetical protein BD289DRAFT_383755 [Coniella lustricola]|uniref:Tim17/Tim22/Tim23/Pmp24 family-domain-containing protein n=1 Tax=Coniella lustricola TaxID=2025994 RepID=A0A2T3AHU0_9PEZI|nr:hypothetical protein BD289DRAFT_383755 [Coniella lustricola]
MAPHGDSEPYHPVDAVAAGTNAALLTGGAGFFAASIKNAMRAKNVGALAVFTKTGGLIFTWTAMGGAFEFARNASANLRQKHDHYNHAIGGFCAGAILGLHSGRMPAVLGWGVSTALLMSGFEFSGGTLLNRKTESAEMEEWDTKEKLRTLRRRPIEETIALVGEGRGIQPPGYQERRRERLRETYGFEVNPVSADGS